MPAITMTIEDDMFQSGCSAIVNTVNCVGVSGRGLALKFKEDFPNNQAAYETHCRQRMMKPGGILVTEENNVHVINMATKDHWRNPSEPQWIVQGVAAMKEWAEKNGIESIACPALGAGLGGLDWGFVQQTIVDAFNDSAVSVHVYPPKPGPAYGATRNRFSPR